MSAPLKKGFRPIHHDPYGKLAPIYEGLEALYSGGAIGASKRALMDRFTPGERVLFVGCGTAGEAVYAARRGALVALCDTSPAMLARAVARFRRAGLADPETLNCSWERLPVGRVWPNIAAHFFLNLFPAQTLQRVIRGLIERLPPGGRLLVADFAPFGQGKLPVWMQKAYWYLPLWVNHWLTGDPLHELFDFGEALAENGCRIECRQDVPIFKYGPPWFRTIVARVQAPTDSGCKP